MAHDPELPPRNEELSALLRAELSADVEDPPGRVENVLRRARAQTVAHDVASFFLVGFWNALLGLVAGWSGLVVKPPADTAATPEAAEHDAPQDNEEHP